MAQVGSDGSTGEGEQVGENDVCLQEGGTGGVCVEVGDTGGACVWGDEQIGETGDVIEQGEAGLQEGEVGEEEELMEQEAGSSNKPVKAKKTDR